MNKQPQGRHRRRWADRYPSYQHKLSIMRRARRPSGGGGGGGVGGGGWGGGWGGGGVGGGGVGGGGGGGGGGGDGRASGGFLREISLLLCYEVTRELGIDDAPRRDTKINIAHHDRRRRRWKARSLSSASVLRGR